MRKYQIVRVGDEQYGLPGQFVLKSLPYRAPATQATRLHDSVTGSFQDCGSVVLMMETRKLFGLPCMYWAKTSIVVTQTGILRIGLVVDAVEDYVSLARESEPRPIPPDFGLPEAVPYLSGVVRGETLSEHRCKFYLLNIEALATCEFVLAV